VGPARLADGEAANRRPRRLSRPRAEGRTDPDELAKNPRLMFVAGSGQTGRWPLPAKVHAVSPSRRLLAPPVRAFTEQAGTAMATRPTEYGAGSRHNRWATEAGRTTSLRPRSRHGLDTMGR
jgi:hypothetical protein